MTFYFPEPLASSFVLAMGLVIGSFLNVCIYRLPIGDSVVHPRVYGSVGRILGPFVRDLKLFSLETAVHKLSGFAAERFQLRDRGVLAEGAFADAVVFDPARITSGCDPLRTLKATDLRYP